MATPECPVCGRVDQVQLASAAVAAGYVDSFPTGLARRLWAPTASKNGCEPGYYYLVWPVAAIVFALIVGGLASAVRGPLSGVIVASLIVGAGAIIYGWKL